MACTSKDAWDLLQLVLSLRGNAGYIMNLSQCHRLFLFHHKHINRLIFMPVSYAVYPTSYFTLNVPDREHNIHEVLVF